MPVASELKFNEDYHLRDPKKKTKAWGDRCVTAGRREWQPIIDQYAAERNRKIVDAKQDLEKVKAGFKKSENGEGFYETTSWAPIAVYNRLVKTLMAEFIKGAYNPDVEAIDVAAELKRKRDKNMLANRGRIEGVMNQLGSQVGDPPYKIPLEKFEGNVEDFDKMGLNSDEPDDIEFFFSGFHRLWVEVSAEKLTRSLMQYNEFEKTVRKLVVDILANNAISYQTRAHAGTGEILWSYLRPEYVKAIRGERDDLKDAMCVGYEKNVTVREFISKVGSEFDFSRESHREALRRAVNHYNHTNYVAIDSMGCWDVDEKGQRYVSTPYNSMLAKHSVGIGYMEWKSFNADTFKRHKVSGMRVEIDYDTEVTSQDYEKIYEDYERTYKAWYLVEDTNSQMLFKFGTLYHPFQEGNDDEFCGYSINAFISQDKSVIEITEQYNYIVQLAFYKILWGLWESTPSVEYYDYDAIARVIENMVPSNGGSSPEESATKSAIEGSVDQIVKQYAKSLKRLYVPPNRAQGGDSKPHFKEPGGVDPIAIAMTTVLEWAEDKILEQIGINRMRSGESPNPKDGYRVQQNSLRASENATYDVPLMIMALVKDVCTTSLRIAQDAIEHKTKVFNWIENLIGTDGIAAFKSLDKIPLHRFGIFVDMFNSQDKLEQVKQRAGFALQNKEITQSQFALIDNMDDPKQIALMLAYYQQKALKEAEKQAALAHDRAKELQKIQSDGKIAEEAARKDREIAVEDRRGYYLVAAQKGAAEADLAKKQMDIAANPQKMMDRARADIMVKREQANIEAQKPLPQATTEAQPQQTSVQEDVPESQGQQQVAV